MSIYTMIRTAESPSRFRAPMSHAFGITAWVQDSGMQEKSVVATIVPATLVVDAFSGIPAWRPPDW